ncbi:hypothetical protein [Actinomadura atramentaria]|uniref:hypothetical protein n=1 Tax=Actinomadura atramentaria TaxID=1990 RepID=UPI0003719D1C|nr:hypothetical protein [Actinomadura atramentaria]
MSPTLSPTKKSLTRRIVVTATAAALAGGAFTGVASADTTGYTDPVGKWQGTVTHGTQTDQINLTFTAGGKVCLTTPISAGTGTWSKTGGRTFTYHLKEVFTDGSGWVDVTQDNTEPGWNAFTGSGPASIYDAAGNLLATTNATSSLTRTSWSSSGC